MVAPRQSPRRRNHKVYARAEAIAATASMVIECAQDRHNAGCGAVWGDETQGVVVNERAVQKAAAIPDSLIRDVLIPFEKMPHFTGPWADRQVPEKNGSE